LILLKSIAMWRACRTLRPFGSFWGPHGKPFVSSLKDIFTFDYFWINTFTLGATGLVVGAVSAKFFKESKRAEFIIVFIFTALSMSLHYILISAFSKSLTINYQEYFFTSVIANSIYTSLVSIPLYAVLINIYNLKEVDEFL